MNKLFKIFCFSILIILLGSCGDKEIVDDEKKKEETSGVKPEITTFKFVSTGIDCGAYTQTRTGAMIHINTEKCHNETYRPTLTLVFESGNPISVGEYTIGKNSKPGISEVYITASDYMNPNLQPQIAWLAVEGSIKITVNDGDATKFDVEFKSIKMQNTSFALTTDIPEYDTLTGYIIGV